MNNKIIGIFICTLLIVSAFCSLAIHGKGDYAVNRNAKSFAGISSSRINVDITSPSNNSLFLINTLFIPTYWEYEKEYQYIDSIWYRVDGEVKKNWEYHFPDIDADSENINQLLNDIGLPTDVTNYDGEIWYRVGTVWCWLQDNELVEGDPNYDAALQFLLNWQESHDAWISIEGIAQMFLLFNGFCWGKCMSRAQIFTTLLYRVGISMDRCAILRSMWKSDWSEHMFTGVYVYGYWVYLDPTVIGDEFPFDSIHSVPTFHWGPDYTHPNMVCSAYNLVTAVPLTYNSVEDKKPTVDIQFDCSVSGGTSPYTYYWTSSVDGYFSSEKLFNILNLSMGLHKITLIVTGNSNLLGTCWIYITISKTGDVVWVDDDFNPFTLDWGVNYFKNIQDGINAIGPYGSVFVHSGTYNENVLVDKTMYLIGAGKDTTVINAGGRGDVVRLFTSGIYLSRFSITNSGGEPDGKGVWIGSNTQDIIIDQCDISNNNWWGIYTFKGSYHTIQNCIISNNEEHGIVVYEQSNNLMRNCEIYGNSNGINDISNSFNNVYTGCYIHNNQNYGVLIYHENEPSVNNIFYHNNFKNNKDNAIDSYSNIWNLGYPMGGNYWSDYIGSDNYNGPNQDIPGSDDIGDIPYDIAGGNNQDKYPLTKMYIENTPPNKPQRPSGPTSGTDGVEYPYTTSTIDPDGNKIYYKFNWGDGTDSGWLGPQSSGAIGNATHAWTTKGTYSIKVKSKDIYNAESEWSDSLSISMPKNKAINIIMFLNKLIKRFPLFEKILNQIA